jgi:imidazoleglycerol phosphate dehydratase HisB
VTRNTAESGLSVVVDFERKRPFDFHYEGPPIEHYGEEAFAGFRDLLQRMADRAGFSLQAVFQSKVLSSSHVLLEDTGRVLGKALSEVLIQRMHDQGVNGAGSSLRTSNDYRRQAITVGVSVEGRKFFRFVPRSAGMDEVRRKLLIGRTVLGGLYSEDLDDFLDGLTWGFGCSLAVHVKDLPDPDDAWRMIFDHLGLALNDVFQPNPYRKGVPPGVKANLS